MKNLCKSSRHQNQNTFVFKSFTERIEKLQISSSTRKDGKFSAVPQDADSFFGEALDKWIDLNCTQHFVDFRREISGEVKSLPQLVYHQKSIVEALLRHLRIPNSLALHPLLDLVVQLSRDLQGDFYREYFEHFFTIFITLLSVHHHNVEALEQIFVSLSFLFKFLSRHMLNNINNVYELLSPLLSSDKYRSYINSFAAEAFSFLIRKHKNVSGFLDYMFESVDGKQHLISGAGGLLFEVVKGIQRQFHSLADKLVPMLLDKLCDPVHQETKLAVLRVTWLNMVKYTTCQYFTGIAAAMLNKLQSLQLCLKEMSNEKVQIGSSMPAMAAVLRLVSIWISHKGGYLITDQNRLVQVLLDLLEDVNLPLSSKVELFNVTATLLMSSNCDLEVQHRPRLLTAVYNCRNGQREVFEFTIKLFDISLFEKDILPRLIDYCYAYGSKSTANDDDDGDVPMWNIVHMLLSLVSHKMSRDEVAGDLEAVHTYNIDFSSAIRKNTSDGNFVAWLTSQLTRVYDQLAATNSNLSCATLWSIVCCIRHVRPIDVSCCGRHVAEIIRQLLSLKVSTVADNCSDADERLWLIYECVVTLVHLVGSDAMLQLVPVDLLLDNLSKYPSNVDCLRSVAVCLSMAREHNRAESFESLLSVQKFNRILASVERNLLSPYSQVRLLTLRICCLFSLPLPVVMSTMEDNVRFEQRGVYQISLDAESTPATLEDYRNKLIHLRKLDQRFVANQLPAGQSMGVPLRYLIGQLHVNFELLWKPVSELIKSYTEAMSLNEFWSVYGPVLEEATTSAEHELHANDDVSLPLASSSDSNSCQISISNLYNDLRDRLHTVDDRPNYSAFRSRLWTTMHSFPQVCEPRSRLIVPVFFKFLEKEFYPSDLNEAPTQDLRVISNYDDEEDNDEDDDVDESRVMERRSQNKSESVRVEEPDLIDGELKKSSIVSKKGTKTKRKRTNQMKRLPKASNNVLIIHLKLFSLFHTPRSLYQESRLHALYLELLKHKAPPVQKAGFDCLVTYSHKYLIPYKESLYRVLDDKTFRDEIVLFSIDSEQSVVKTEHRADLIPILMRILYGKMRLRLGKNTGGRMQSQARKNILLSFVASSQAPEMHSFLDLILQSFAHFISDDVAKKVNQIISDTDIAAVIPLRKMQGVLNTMEMILLKLGHLIQHDYLSRLLQIVVCVSAVCTGLLSSRTELAPYAVKQIKTIRQTAQSRINEVFVMFEKYPYSTLEIEAIFVASVWPQIERLATEGVYAPTPLLRLILTWSQNQRFYCLLAKCHVQRPQVTCLPFIFELLQSKTIAPTVVTMVMEIVENLLTNEESDDHDQSEAVASIDPGPMWKLDVDRVVPYGTSLLLPYVHVILAHLTQVVEKLVIQQSKQKSIPTQELNILSILSGQVDDEEQSSKIVSLLLPFLGRRLKRSVDTEVAILTSIKNLIRQLKQPQPFLPTMARLFSCLTAPQSRTALCSVLTAIAEKDESLVQTLSLVLKLNAWDARHVEEPDYSKRLDGFTTAVKLLKQDGRQGSADESIKEELDTTLLLMLTHNCFYLLSTTEDLALRSGSVDCLQQLIQAVSRGTGDKSLLYKTVILGHVLPEVKLGLKHRVEVSRHGFLAVLSQLVRDFPSAPVFSDLVALHDDADPERDFFDNITHVQIHRRARALRRMAIHVATVRVRNDTLVSFLLPIVTAFFRDDAYRKQTDLLDAAVDATSAIARCLTWHHYQLLLLHHLGALGKELINQKLVVRILVSVLDSFHFELKNSHFTPKLPYDASVKVVGPLRTTAEQPVETENSVKQEEEMDANEFIDDKTVIEEMNATAMADGEGEEEEEGVDKDSSTSDSGDDKGQLIPPPPGSTIVCPPGLATRIHRAIVVNILPQLHRCLTERTKSDDQHKLAQVGKYAEDEEILRVPIALAMVKLLQTLPTASLNQNLPGILLRVCQFLGSRAQDIRECSRSTLTKIMHSLGPAYFRYVLNEMRSVLKRGYQLHVLCFTIWKLLEDLKTSLQSGDLDSCIQSLTEIFNEELFGNVAEEKDVEGILSKVFEARTTKSIDSYGLLALFVSKDSLAKLILPLKEVLDNTRSNKQSKKVMTVLDKIGSGLIDNKSLDLENTMIFIYGLTTDSLARVIDKTKGGKSAQKEKRDPRLQPPSTFLITNEPARSGNHKVKGHAEANMYILVDFGLQLLHRLLKRSILVSTNQQHLQLLDPFVTTIIDCLSSKHVHVSTTALRCLTWLLKFSLPTLKAKISVAADQMFVLLRSYAVAGAGTGENFELVVVCFKAVTVLVRDVHYHEISSQQLQVLLGFAEQDLNDYTRRATAFSILKAILSRKLIVKEMTSIIEQVESLSVTAEAPDIQQQCRQVVLQYLLDYPLPEPQLRKHLEFFVRQREYEHESGRKSVLEMLASIFNSFPQKVVGQHSGLFFVPLVERLNNEESSHCKELTALAIKTLLAKLDDEQRDHLFSCCVIWMKNFKATLRTLAALAVGLFVEVETASFERHLDLVLPLIEEQVSKQKYEQAYVSDKDLRSADHLLFLYLDLLLKIFQECPIIHKPQWTSILNKIWDHVQAHLLYEHEWVRLASARLFGMLFCTITPEDVLTQAKDKKNKNMNKNKKRKHADNNVEEEGCELEYLQQNLPLKLHNLCGSFCNQLSSPILSQALADQIVKNLLFLCKVIKLLPAGETSIAHEVDPISIGAAMVEERNGDTAKPMSVSIHWLIMRLGRVVKAEIDGKSKTTIKRASVFKWLAALSLDLAASGQLMEYLARILPTLVREVTDSSTTADPILKALAHDVIELIRKTAGTELFNKDYSLVLRTISAKRDKRKNERSLEAVTNPELAAKKKLKKNLKKRETKKRQIDKIRPGAKNAKKRKTEHLARTDAF